MNLKKIIEQTEYNQIIPWESLNNKKILTIHDLIIYILDLIKNVYEDGIINDYKKTEDLLYILSIKYNCNVNHYMSYKQLSSLLFLKKIGFTNNFIEKNGFFKQTNYFDKLDYYTILFNLMTTPNSTNYKCIK
jgi:hypothetical protein